MPVSLSKLVTLNTATEFICFLVALICLYKDKSAAWRLLIVYLMLTFCAETTGLVIRKVFLTANLPVYNTFVIVECFFTSFFFYSLFKVYGYSSKWLYGWLAVFAIIYITEITYKRFADFVDITASVMSIVFVFSCMWYYYLKLTDEGYEPLTKSGQFWWVSGALFFYFGSTACNIFFDYLKTNEISTYNGSIRYIIFNVLNIILYSFWSISSVCRYRQRKLSRL